MKSTTPTNQPERVEEATLRVRTCCSRKASASIFFNTSIYWANQHAARAAYKQCGLRSVLWKRHKTVGGGLNVAQHCVAYKTGIVITMEVLMVQVPSGTGMIDTGCRSACGGHHFRASLQAAMDNMSWPYRKVQQVALCQLGIVKPIPKVCGCTKLES